MQEQRERSRPACCTAGHGDEAGALLLHRDRLHRAGCYQGFLLTQHLSWPILTAIRKKTKLAPPMLRYAAGTAVAVTGGGLGLFFFWTPSRLATRVTLYPATSQIGIRTAARPFRAFLPPSMRSKKSAPINAQDPSERFHPLDALYRRDRTSAVEIEQFAQAKGDE